MRYKQTLTAALLALALAPAAHAHSNLFPAAGFTAGFTHPWLGLDHLLAMLSIGLWAAFLTPGSRRVWRLPALFLGLMVAGGALGVAGVALPGVEAGIATSVLLLGLAMGAMARLPQGFAGLLAGLFALCHGHAHGAEMLAGTGFWSYALGFVAATGLLHLTGVLAGGALLHRPVLYRTLGGLIGGLGGLLLIQAT